MSDSTDKIINDLYKKLDERYWLSESSFVPVYVVSILIGLLLSIVWYL